MTLQFIPNAHSTPIAETVEGDEATVRRQTAQMLRTARHNGAAPRCVHDGVLTRIYKLTNGVLKLCL